MKTISSNLPIILSLVKKWSGVAVFEQIEVPKALGDLRTVESLIGAIFLLMKVQEKTEAMDLTDKVNVNHYINNTLIN